MSQSDSRYLEQLREIASVLEADGFSTSPTTSIFVKKISEECSGWVLVAGDDLRFSPRTGIVCPAVNRLSRDCGEGLWLSRAVPLEPEWSPPIASLDVSALSKTPRPSSWEYSGYRRVDRALARDLAQVIVDTTPDYFGKFKTVRTIISTRDQALAGEFLLPAAAAWLKDRKRFEAYVADIEGKAEALEHVPAREAMLTSSRTYHDRLRQACFG